MTLNDISFYLFLLFCRFFSFYILLDIFSNPSVNRLLMAPGSSLLNSLIVFPFFSYFFFVAPGLVGKFMICFGNWNWNWNENENENGRKKRNTPLGWQFNFIRMSWESRNLFYCSVSQNDIKKKQKKWKRKSIKTINDSCFVCFSLVSGQKIDKESFQFQIILEGF